MKSRMWMDLTCLWSASGLGLCFVLCALWNSVLFMILTGASNPQCNQSYIEVENIWTFSRYFVQDCLLKAQRALAVLYEDRYPCSNLVQRGLRELLYQRCNGSRHEFNDNFLRPTIALLEKLKEQVKYLKYIILLGGCAGGPGERTCMDGMGPACDQY